MDQKTKRTLIRTIKNISKGVLFVILMGGFMFGSLLLSHHYTGDLYLGFAGMTLPILFYSIWDYSQKQVEHEIEQEERLIRELSRNQSNIYHDNRAQNAP